MALFPLWSVYLKIIEIEIDGFYADAIVMNGIFSRQQQVQHS